MYNYQIIEKNKLNKIIQYNSLINNNFDLELKPQKTNDLLVFDEYIFNNEINNEYNNKYKNIINKKKQSIKKMTKEYNNIDNILESLLNNKKKENIIKHNIRLDITNNDYIYNKDKYLINIIQNIENESFNGNRRLYSRA